MRPEYITLIKDFLTKNPQYQNSLHQVKIDILSIGATEEEFTEAISQLGLSLSTQNQVESLQKKQKFSLKEQLTKFHNQSGIKKLIEIDIITHAAVAVIVVIPLCIWSLTMFSKADTTPYATASESITSASHQNTKSVADSIVPRVYASSDSIDATRVFSFPSSPVTLTITGRPKKEVYGFFPYWMVKQEEKINIDELTSIALFGLEVDGKGNIITAIGNQPEGGWAMWNDPKVNDLIARAKKKRVKVEITMKAFDRTNIEQLVTSDEAQTVFISNVLHLVNLKSLDGVNLDFEYIGRPPDEVTAGFTRLVTNLRAELKRQLPESTLTIATFINAASIPGIFDVELLAEQSDALILMGYDIHTPKGPPGPVAPLDGPVSILGFMQSYLEKVPSDKIILAVPYYGYDWPIKADGTPTGDPGRTLPYAEIAELSKGKTIAWDEIGQTPSLRYIDNETGISRVLYYENTRSLGQKYDLINKKNLKGMGIWALGYDGLNNDLRSLIIEKFAN